MAEKINVKSALKPTGDGGFPIALFERHPAHENGELFIADDKVHNVAMTPGVALALNEKRLVQTDEEANAVPEPSRDDTDSAPKVSPEAAALESSNSRAELEAMAEEEGLDPKAFPDNAQLAQAIIGNRAQV